MPLYRTVLQWLMGLELLVLCFLFLPTALQPRAFQHRQKQEGHGFAWCTDTGTQDVFIAGQAAVMFLPSKPAHAISIHSHSPEALEQAVMQTSTASKMETEDMIYKSFLKCYDNGLLINRRGRENMGSTEGHKSCK